MTSEHQQWIDECIRQMKEAVTPKGYNSPTLGYINRSPSMVTYWAGITSHGHIFHADNQYCHAELDGGFNSSQGVYNEEEDEWAYTSHLSEEGEKPLFVVSRIQWENNVYRQLPVECIDRFLHWLTLEGPYTRVFVKKGGKANRKRGYLVARCDVPSNLLAGALFAGRMLTEHFGSIVWVWWKLVQRGVHPSLAFYNAHQVSCKDHDNVYIESFNWHSPLSGGRATLEHVLNFKQKKMINPCLRYDVDDSYCNIHALWGSNYGACVLGDELPAIKQAVMRGEEVKAIANPFLNVRMKETCDVDKFCDIWAKKLIEIYGEDNE